MKLVVGNDYNGKAETVVNGVAGPQGIPRDDILKQPSSTAFFLFFSLCLKFTHFETTVNIINLNFLSLN